LDFEFEASQHKFQPFSVEVMSEQILIHYMVPKIEKFPGSYCRNLLTLDDNQRKALIGVHVRQRRLLEPWLTQHWSGLVVYS